MQEPGREIEEQFSSEDRLKAIAYQFVSLYERWSEDRQIAAKQGADIHEVIKVFEAQVKGFKMLEPQVREQIRLSIQQAAQSASKEVGEALGKAASFQVAETTQRFQTVVEKAEHSLQRYENENTLSMWMHWGGPFLIAVALGFLVAKFVVPTPYLPLTDKQLQTYQDGKVLEAIWPKLPEKEKKHFSELIEKMSPVTG